MNNPRPTIGTRKKVQLMVILTLLAWATQTLMHQWGFGQTLPASVSAEELPAATAPVDPQPDPRVLHVDLDAQTATLRERPAPPAEEPAERFVPGTARFAAGATLELRSEARVTGAEVRLRQVCRWNDADREVFEPLSDLVLFRLDERTPFATVATAQIRQTLRDAGANLAVIKFSGPTTCTVSRGDVSFNEGDALEKWADAAQAKAGGTAATGATDDAAAAAPPAATAPAAADDTRFGDVAGGAVARPDDGPIKTLRSLLAIDLAGRLGVPADDLQLTFNPRDEKVLKLAEPVFKFHIEPKRVRNLGSVVWDVTLTTADGGADPQTVTIAGSSRAWQRQVVLNRPLTYKQVIRAQDVTERRTLVDRLPEDTLLDQPQIVGQQAARDLKPGTVMTAKLVNAVPLVQPGQFVTVSLERGGVKIKTVARAIEGGSFGQTVRVKNEATKDVYEIVLTGPQEGTLGSIPSAVVAGGEPQPQPKPKPTGKPEQGTASLGND